MATDGTNVNIHYDLAAYPNPEGEEERHKVSREKIENLWYRVGEIWPEGMPSCGMTDAAKESGGAPGTRYILGNKETESR